jgi:uncharacterized protein YegP (UPF0339 family)
MYFTIYQDAGGQWRWRLKAANHEIVAAGEGYTSKDGCLHAITLVQGSASAPIREE